MSLFTNDQILGINGQWTGHSRRSPSRDYRKHTDLVDKYNVGLITRAEAEQTAERRWTEYCRNK